MTFINFLLCGTGAGLACAAGSQLVVYSLPCALMFLFGRGVQRAIGATATVGMLGAAGGAYLGALRLLYEAVQ